MNTLLKSSLIAAGIIAAAIFATNAFANDIEETSKTVHKLTLGGEFFGLDATADICSAVAVSPNQLVTAAHCVPLDKDIDILIRTEKLGDDLKVLSSSTVFLQAVRIDKRKDTAFLETLDKDYTFPAVAEICEDYTPKLGDEMMTIGFPSADVKMATKGMFGAVVSFDKYDMDKFWKTSVPVVGGNSGGGLFVPNEDGYCLAGLATARFPDSFESFFSPLSSLKEITKNLINSGKPVPLPEVPELKRSGWAIDLR